MALINCTECGREVSDKATSCPHCGCPVSIVSVPVTPSKPVNSKPMEQVNNQIQQNNTKKKDSVLSIIAAAFALFTITCFVGLIIGIIDLCINDKNKRHVGSWFAVIWFVIFVIVMIL